MGGKEDRGLEGRGLWGEEDAKLRDFFRTRWIFFRASGFLVNPAEAAKGTDAFKRANEKEKNESRQFCSS